MERQRLTGFAADVIRETEFRNHYENVTVTTTTLDRANKQVTETTVYPGAGEGYEAVAVTRNGLLRESTSRTGATYTFEYDDLGRRTKTLGPRSSVWQQTVYHPTNGRVTSVENADGDTTSYAYDETTSRLKTVTNADNKVTR